MRQGICNATSHLKAFLRKQDGSGEQCNGCKYYQVFQFTVILNLGSLIWIRYQDHAAILFVSGFCETNIIRLILNRSEIYEQPVLQ